MRENIIKAKLLDCPAITHGTSTKFFGNMSINRDTNGFAPINRAKFFTALGIDKQKSYIVFPKIKQSANVALISTTGLSSITYLEQDSPAIIKLAKFPGINPPADYISNPEFGIDACISNSPHLFIAMLPADCAPVFLFDPVTGYYALVHAGVLGAFSGIVGNTINCLKTWCAVEAKNIIAYIGPAISATAYNLKSSGLWQQVLQDKVPAALAENFDLKLFLHQQLISAGVEDTNIEVSVLCTALSDDLFFSNYSAKTIEEKQTQGRHMSIIGKK